jgi:Asp-tRNA(Asn)/Glu-tRNA(Gln) amidotransferase A subunit family amidase
MTSDSEKLLQGLLDQDLHSQSAALAQGLCSSAALTEAVLQRTLLRQPALHAFLHVDVDGAREAAAQSDMRRSRAQALGPLDGLSLAVKDNIDVAGLPTTAGMATRQGRIATQDAFVVQRLRAAGMVVLGKLNMHEAALGATNDNPHFGRCNHPHHAGFTPGGSSGGSACAVAAGLCALALGTDTLGSVRIPAAYCGVVGFKASYGAISTRGTVACCHALDHVGPLVRSRRDLQRVLPHLLAFDALCADARPHFAQAAVQRPRWVVADDVFALGTTAPVAQAYERAVQALRDRGDTVTTIHIAGHDFGRARRAGLLMVEADMLLTHADDWRDQPANFSDELQRFMRYGQNQSAAALAAAQRTVALAHTEAARWFSHGDVMLLPTAPQTAFAFGDAVPANQADFTAIANMAGLAAMSVPLPVGGGGLPPGLPPGLPIGLQLIAPAGAEATLLAANLQGVCVT